MERIVPIAVAFALGAVAASMVQFPAMSWSSDTTTLIEPLETPVRYTLPADVASLRVFMR